MAQSRYVTPAEAGTELGLSDAHVRRLCAAGRIEGAKKTWGGVWMVPSPVVYVDRKPSGRPNERRRPDGYPVDT